MMRSSGTMFCFVNLPGGYASVTLDGRPVPQDVDRAQQKALQETLRTRQSVAMRLPIDNRRELQLETWFDENGADDTGRTGVILLVGAYGEPELEFVPPRSEHLTSLSEWRSIIIASALTPDLGRMAFCGLLNSIVELPATSTATQDNAAVPLGSAKARAPYGLWIDRRRLLNALTLAFAVASLIISIISYYTVLQHISAHEPSMDQLKHRR